MAETCNCIQLSLDGASAEVHDAIRGRGSFAATAAAVDLLRHCGARLRIAVTVMPENAADLSAHLLPLLQWLR